MTELKVITWNCNGAFRKKFQHLDQFDADVSVTRDIDLPTYS
jgi:hypothetical protein